jgi:predicted phosphodiesterase
VRVAVLADVHGNAPALEAVLAEVEADAIVFAGDLTWGPLPAETLELVRALELPTRFVRGNAERALLEAEENGHVRWLREQHGEEGMAWAAACEKSVVVEIDGLGPVRICHGSPRSDTELVTERTPEERVREFMDGVPERVVVTAHTHVRYDRVAAGVRLLNAGSVGMPYQAPEVGAFWALLGPDVDFRRTVYDRDAAFARMAASGYPGWERIEPVLREPPTPDEVIEDAERLVFTE